MYDRKGTLLYIATNGDERPFVDGINNKICNEIDGLELTRRYEH